MIINYWDCINSDYDESLDGEEEVRIYGCDHPNGKGVCTLENKFSGKEDCPLLDLPIKRSV